MVLKIFRIDFLKKTAKLNRESCKKFGIETLKNFGGVSLLSSVKVESSADSLIEVTCEDDLASNLVSCAMTLNGIYQEAKCKITEV